MASSITIGSDPELFLCDRHGEVIPAGHIAPDGKEFDPDTGPEIVRDGIMLELRPKPASSVDEALVSTRKTLSNAFNLACEHNLLLRAESRMPVTDKTLSLCTPDALIFGCDPDWSAYTRRKQAIRVDARKHPWRYAGGHIHIGTDSLHKPSDIISLCKVFDIFVGLPSVMMDRSEGSIRRRKLYGRAGSFRPQPHGFEWRVPSNFWLKSPVLAKGMFELSEFAYRVWDSPEGDIVLSALQDQYAGGFDSVMRQTVDTSDAQNAKKILASACMQLLESQFPPLWWDIAVCHMRSHELPFGPLSSEWRLGLPDSEFEFGKSRLRSFMESLTLTDNSHVHTEERSPIESREYAAAAS